MLMFTFTTLSSGERKHFFYTHVTLEHEYAKPEFAKANFNKCHFIFKNNNYGNSQDSDSTDNFKNNWELFKAISVASSAIS